MLLMWSGNGLDIIKMVLETNAQIMAAVELWVVPNQPKISGTSPLQIPIFDMILRHHGTEYAHETGEGRKNNINRLAASFVGQIRNGSFAI